MGRKTKKRQSKRDQKKREHKRRISGSPYRRAAQNAQVAACYASEGWEEAGILTLYIILKTTNNRLIVTTFLIDLWCIGLKDAYGLIDISREQLDEHMELAKNRLNLVRIDQEQARQFVAGAIRFSRENGFKLPAKYERWTRMLGDLGDIEQADLSHFRTKDGKLCYVGPIEELKNRLIGCTAEQFLQRRDVEYIFGPDGSELADLQDDIDFDDEEYSEDDLDGEEIDSENDWLDYIDPDDPDAEMLMETRDQFVEMHLEWVRRWCFRNGMIPAPRLEEVCRLFYLTFLEWLSGPEHDDDSFSQNPDEPPVEFLEMLDDLFYDYYPEGIPPKVSQAIQQIIQATDTNDYEAFMRENANSWLPQPRKHE